MNTFTKSTLLIIFTLLCACNNMNEDILLNSMELSNEYYAKDVEHFKDFFETKKNEEPEKYKSTFEKISSVEIEMSKFSKLKTIEDKKAYIEELIPKLKLISELKSIEFLCLKVNNKEDEIFNAVAENDFYRNLFVIYSNFYLQHFKMY